MNVRIDKIITAIGRPRLVVSVVTRFRKVCYLGLVRILAFEIFCEVKVP